MKIVTFVGARPQFIKASAVSQRLADQESLKEIVVHTGQHYDDAMSDIFFRDLNIPTPRYNLGIGSGTHGVQTGRMLSAIESVLLTERPDVVLVYGDTNSTLAGALAAAKLHIPIAHIEAGLRSFNRRQPEEINRVLTDHLSKLLFTPTSVASGNLRNEGITNGAIHQVGDVMYDVILLVSTLTGQKSRILGELGLIYGEYILATIHRAENTDDPKRLRNLINALAAVSRALPVVLPLHPRTRKAMDAIRLSAGTPDTLRIINPVSYVDMVVLEKNACVVATDSGGVQKEAFFCRVPCVTLRGETEWTELVEAGWNRLVSPDDPDRMVSAIRAAIGTKGAPVEEYGAGNSASRIVHTLIQELVD